MKIAVFCQQCGKPFQVKPSDIKNGRGKHCSRKCKGIAASIRNASLTRKAIENKFWSKVDKRGPDECWEWQGKGDYGRFCLCKKVILAHRYSWSLVNGDVPEGFDILHSCDNPGCVNPAHLRPGTQIDNNRDMEERGRRRGGSLPGERHNMAKLTWGQVREIRQRYIPFVVSSVQLGKEYGVYHQTILRIVNRTGWKESNAQ